MAFFEQRMNPDLTYGARGGPAWSTSKSYSQSGRRAVIQNWSFPLHRYDVASAVKWESDFRELLNFFYVVAGQFDGFRFKDWHDFRSAGQGVLTTTPAGLQMFKNYTLGARTFSRKISKPCAGVTVTGKPGATIDTTTGLVTGAAPGDAWEGEFDVPVAFASDEFMPELIARGGNELIVSSGPIMLEEIRL